jgi:hypothetical protein
MANPPDDRDRDTSAIKASELATEIMDEITAKTQTRRGRALADEKPSAELGLRLVAAGLVFTCLTLTALNLSGFAPLYPGVPRVSDEDRLAQLRRTLNYAVRAIETYREAHGVWPRSVDDLGAPTDVLWTYEPTEGGRYRISVADGNFVAGYDSLEDADEAFRELRHP